MWSTPTVTFDVKVALKATAIALNSSSKVPDKKYRVSDNALEVALPTFSITEPEAYVDTVYSLESNPSFVSIITKSDGTKVISIHTTNVADSNPGIYDITIRFKDNYSQISATDTFRLTLSCVTAINKVTDVAWTGVVYYLSKDAITRSPTNSFTLTPAGCRNDLTFTVTQADSTALPSPTISFTGTQVVVHDTNLLAE